MNHSRGRSLLLPQLGKKLGTQGQPRTRMCSPENLVHFLLMFRIGVGVKETDSNRSNPESPYPSRNPDSLRSVKRFQDPPIIRDPLPDLKPESSPDQRRQTLNL